MATLAELLKQKEELDKKIEAARSAEREGIIKEIVARCKEYSIKYADLKPHMTTPRKNKKNGETA